MFRGRSRKAWHFSHFRSHRLKCSETEVGLKYVLKPELESRGSFEQLCEPDSKFGVRVEYSITARSLSRISSRAGFT